jgi:hypothetical protein
MRSTLPHSPRKRHSVLLAVSETLVPPSDVEITSPARGTNKRLSECIIHSVRIFYERDDVSRMAPGRRDYQTIRNEDGQKEKVQEVFHFVH